LGNILNSSGGITANNYVDVDVTGNITGNGLVSFGLSTTETSLIQVSSREGNNPPELVVQFDGGAGPTPTPTNTTVPPTPTSTGVPPTPTNTAVPPTATATTGPGGSTFTFTSSDDAILLSNRPTSNYGTATILGTDDAPDIFSVLKFNVAGLDGAVASATLRVFVTSGSFAFNVAEVANNTWSEASVTYSNAPTAGASINGSGPVTSGWVEIDVTSYISGDGTFSLALLADAAGRNLFSSDEAGNGPELIVVTGP
ncbi:MAG: DNRLRE domain-containing protein, partial [Anaerolineales bacterium]|nr:DNRLRE domain-containing protein [Anaerolineales bacterium]